MAGKWYGYTPESHLGPGYKPRLVRAYAEGRAGYQAANPFVAGSPQAYAWDYGDTNKADAAFKYETAIT